MHNSTIVAQILLPFILVTKRPEHCRNIRTNRIKKKKFLIGYQALASYILYSPLAVLLLVKIYSKQLFSFILVYMI